MLQSNSIFINFILKTPLVYTLVAMAFTLTACHNKSATTMKAPQAKKQAHEILMHNDKRTDDYYWMRLSDSQKEADSPDAQTQEVLSYLQDENAYLEREMAPTKNLQATLFNEMVARIKKTDESVPVYDKGYWYYTRYVEGKDYPYSCRKKGSMEAEEQMLLDQPAMAEGLAYFAVGGAAISPNNKLLAYSTDTVSRRQYTIFVKDIASGDILPDRLSNTTGGAIWANDNKTIFYSVKDPVTLRAYRIYKHVLGTEQSQDVLVYEEKDETFSCYVYKTKSDKYIVIASDQTLSSECRYVDADKPNETFKLFQAREKDHLYHISHYKDHFYVITNWQAQNYRLMKTATDATSKKNWKEVVPHRKDVLLEGMDIFKNFLVLEERKQGLMEIRVIPWKDNSNDYYLEFDDPAYLAYTTSNVDFNTDVLRYGYTSLTTPNSTYDFDMNTKERTLLKQQAVMDEAFSPDNYQSERLYVTARDGAKVPVSIVYPKGWKKDGEQPLLLYAYGSYGSSTDPYFSSVRLSLLDRGFAYAIAHIRGGEELGRQWYEDGKLLKKKNTFYDFIDCANYLCETKYTSPNHLYAYGGSAGGLLMGVVINMAPQLWNGVVAAVPFVDVVSTMLDESIPLTTGEFDEWGNPKDKTYYEYMKSYSPYDNIEHKAYPNLLVTTGYWDSQVQYWEPAKWVAKLRDYKTDNNKLYLRCDMEVGHGGASGRFKPYKETALMYAFFLDLEQEND